MGNSTIIAEFLDPSNGCKYRVSLSDCTKNSRTMNPIQYFHKPTKKSDWLYFGCATDIAVEFFNKLHDSELVPVNKTTEALYGN